MQKASHIETPRGHRRLDSNTRAAHPRAAVAALLALVGSLGLSAQPAMAQSEESAAATSMQHIIEAARRKKAQELEAAARRMLGSDTPPAVAAPAAAAPPLIQDTRSEEVPRVWSLSGVDKRLRAELYYQGRIHQVTLGGDHPAQVGPWIVRDISANGVTLSASQTHRGSGRGPSSIVLPPPARGSSMSTYPFQPVSLESGAAVFGSAALPPSALRASRLPMEGGTAMTAPQAY